MDDFDTLFDIPITFKSEKGDPGVGVANLKAVDGNLIVTLTDGRSINAGTLPKAKDGEDGKDGLDGVSITGAIINKSGDLIILLSNGQRVNAGLVRGKDGDNGVSIETARIDQDGHLILIKTDGEEINAGLVRGKDGKATTQFVGSGEAAINVTSPITLDRYTNTIGLDTSALIPVLFPDLTPPNIPYFNGTELADSGLSWDAVNRQLTVSSANDISSDTFTITYDPDSNPDLDPSSAVLGLRRSQRDLLMPLSNSLAGLRLYNRDSTDPVWFVGMAKTTSTNQQRSGQSFVISQYEDISLAGNRPMFAANAFENVIYFGVQARAQSGMSVDPAVPSYSFAGDSNTGLYWISADTIGISTGGVERVRVDGDALYSRNLSLILGDTTNNATKSAIIAVNHYTSTTEEPVSAFFLRSEGAVNKMFIGGGSGLFNAMNEYYFYGAANSTTTGGDEWARFVSDGGTGGFFGLGTTEPLSRLHVAGNYSFDEDGYAIYWNGYDDSGTDKTTINSSYSAKIVLDSSGNFKLQKNNSLLGDNQAITWIDLLTFAGAGAATFASDITAAGTVTGLNGYFGSTTDATTDTKSVTVQSNGFAVVNVHGDSQNTGGEPGGAALYITIDNGLVGGSVFSTQTNNGDGRGGTYTGTTNNAFVIGSYNSVPLEFGTNAVVRGRFTSAGNLEVLNDLAVTGSITSGTWGGTTIPVNKGGTGQTSYTNGQLLIGNSTGNTLTKAALTGTANQVVVTNGAGSITLSTPQNIATNSNVTFNNGTFTGTVTGLNGYFGSTTDATTDTKSVTLESRGFATFIANGDVGNITGDPGGAAFVVTCDARSSGSRAVFSFVNTAGQDGTGTSYVGTVDNSALLGVNGNFALLFGTNGNVRGGFTSGGNFQAWGALTVNTSTSSVNLIGGATVYGLQNNASRNDITVNQSNGYVGFLDQAGSAALTALHSKATNGLVNQLWLQNTSGGWSVPVADMHGILLTSGSMNASARCTPAIIFGSTDAQLTTQNPKPLSYIVGRATETYGNDSDSGMKLSFYVSPDNGGTSNTAELEFEITTSGVDSMAGYLVNGSRLMTQGGPQWFFLNASTTQGNMQWAGDDPSASPAINFRIPFAFVATKISIARDNDTSSTSEYEVTVYNTSAGTNSTFVTTITTSQGADQGSLASPVTFAEGHNMQVELDVLSGATGSEVWVIVYGYQI